MKNKSRNNILLVIFAILIISVGCKDEFFDQKAGDRITPDKHYFTTVDAQVSMMGSFIILQDAMPKLIMLDGVRSDMMETTENADAALRDIAHQIYNSNNPFTNASDLYKVIINVNEVLANIDSVAARDINYDYIVAFAFEGALHSLKAWTYLTLTRLYGQAAYFDSNLTSLPDNLYQNVKNKDEILALLIEDLIPYVHDASSGTEFVEIPMQPFMNVKALLGELYLEQNNYADAAKYLKLACESYQNQNALYKVDQSYKDDSWSNIFLNSENVQLENFSVVPFSRSEDQYNPIARLVGHDFDFMVKPSMIVVDSFMAQITAGGQMGDLYRGKGITFDADTTTWITDSTFIIEPFITKYSIDATNPFSTDIIISRAADVHLLLAEAYNRLGDETSQQNAMMLLNQGVSNENPKPAEFATWSRNLGIRGRVYLDSRMVPERDSIDANLLTLMIEDHIIAERQLELAFEGKRWFDLVRIAERRNDPQYLADKVAAKFEGTGMYDQVHARLMNPMNWYLPFE